MEHKVVWEKSVRKAVEGGFNLEDWNKRVDPESHAMVEKVVAEAQCSYVEAFFLGLKPTKMKALAYSHDFAQAFFPKTKCDDDECVICKNDGGHSKHIAHMKEMCEYCDFTFYLDIILDGGEYEI